MTPVHSNLSTILRLHDVLRTLLPDEVAIAASFVSDAQGLLFPCEEQSVERAASIRRAEFRAGRTVARTALARLGIPAQPVPRARDGRPIWPSGVVGSITHSRTLAVAVVAPADYLISIGVDIELATPLEPSLHTLVGHREEYKAFVHPVDTDAGPIDRGKLVFSIKESVFKAYYPVTKISLDFQDATVEIDAKGNYTARLMPGVPAFLGNRTLCGKWALVADHALTVLMLESASDATKSNGDIIVVPRSG